MFDWNVFCLGVSMGLLVPLSVIITSLMKASRKIATK